MFNEMFEFFVENKLISSSQSDFKPSDSCINQLLSITHEIYSSFDECLEVRSVLLHISKAFDKVWHDDIVFKLTQNGISENLPKLLRDFLNERTTIYDKVQQSFKLTYRMRPGFRWSLKRVFQRVFPKPWVFLDICSGEFNYLSIICGVIH